MRIAAISDVHGNLAGLDAVLADIAERDVDLTVNLGDTLSGALLPAETADRLIQLDLPTVRGNHDRALVTQQPDRMTPSDRHAHNQITERHRAWLSQLPATLTVADGVFAFHGSPGSDLTYLMETVEPTGARPASVAEVTQRLGTPPNADLLLCGHTHLQRAMRLPWGALLLNPGSVGWPAFADDHPRPHRLEAGTPHARYAIATRNNRQWTCEFHTVEYDWEATAAIAQAHRRPDVAHALRTGRA